MQAYYRLVEGKRTRRSYEIEVQGFLNEKGEFLTRTEAWVDAVACKQLLPRAPTSHGGPGTLYSEDVW